MNHTDILDDNILIDELKKRLEEKNRLLRSQSDMIEQMEELNKKLRTAEKVKSDFLSNIRNEINNPLTSILGLSAVIKNDKTSSSNAQKWATLISNEAFNLDYQLRNIFAAAEIEAGEVRYNPSITDVVKIVNQAVTYLLPRVHQNHVRVTFNQSKENLPFATDSYLLQVICVNIISNAVEFSPPDGEVRIGVETSDSHFLLSVQDDGSGITTADQKHIFERFHQVEKGTTKKHQGHGLGLSIVKEFADLMRGEVKIESKENMPTCVSVLLPRLLEHQLEDGFLSSDDEILFGEIESF